MYIIIIIMIIMSDIPNSFLPFFSIVHIASGRFPGLHPVSAQSCCM